MEGILRTSDSNGRAASSELFYVRIFVPSSIFSHPLLNQNNFEAHLHMISCACPEALLERYNYPEKDVHIFFLINFHVTTKGEKKFCFSLYAHTYFFQFLNSSRRHSHRDKNGHPSLVYTNTKAYLKSECRITGILSKIWS